MASDASLPERLREARDRSPAVRSLMFEAAEALEAAYRDADRWECLRCEVVDRDRLEHEAVSPERPEYAGPLFPLREWHDSDEAYTQAVIAWGPVVFKQAGGHTS